MLKNCLSILLVATLLVGACKNSNKGENAVTPHNAFTPPTTTLELEIAHEDLSKKKFVAGEDTLVLKVLVKNAPPGALKMNGTSQLGGEFLYRGIQEKAITDIEIAPEEEETFVFKPMQAGEEEIQFRRHVSAFKKNKTNKILALFRIRFGDN